MIMNFLRNRKTFKNRPSDGDRGEYRKQLEMSCNILKLRKQKKISQAELAKKIGMKQIDIIKIEAGKQNFSISTLEKIAKAFGCELKISISE
ncbi:MAG: helix-turn-helix transcriptional regulator [Candidatus Paceibacterota bacterium]